MISRRGLLSRPSAGWSRALEAADLLGQIKASSEDPLAATVSRNQVQPIKPERRMAIVKSIALVELG